MRLAGDDRGSAIVEFCYLAILLMVPLVYVVLVVFRVQAAAYGITAAVREAGRAYVTAGTDIEADASAEAAAAVALSDHGLALNPDEMTVRCSARPCLSPGGQVEIAIDTVVPLPFLPRVFDGRAPASIALHARHTEIVDEYRPPPG